jgi:glycosyltransferase involved in cell wall biosynthesis
MTSAPTIDIIIPVWNHPFQARSCLVSILNSTDDARLIIINNGSNRETELMLEEFSDHLADRVLYMTMERNIGFIPAVNRGLERSTADWTLIIRPTGAISGNCIQLLTEAFQADQAGIISPLCLGETSCSPNLAKAGCKWIETSQLSFAGLAISRALREKTGTFDNDLDGSDWCLKDFYCRANAYGFRSYLVPAAIIKSGDKLVFGSVERRSQLEKHSNATFLSRWGDKRTYAVYIPKHSNIEQLKLVLEAIMTAARHGHSFKVFMHRRQQKLAFQNGLCCQHTGIELIRLSLFGAIRDLNKKLAALRRDEPDLVAVKGDDTTPFPGCETALPFSALEQINTRQETI